MRSDLGEGSNAMAQTNREGTNMRTSSSRDRMRIYRLVVLRGSFNLPLSRTHLQATRLLFEYSSFTLVCFSGLF